MSLNYVWLEKKLAIFPSCDILLFIRHYSILNPFLIYFFFSQYTSTLKRAVHVFTVDSVESGDTLHRDTIRGAPFYKRPVLSIWFPKLFLGETLVSIIYITSPPEKVPNEKAGS